MEVTVREKQPNQGERLDDSQLIRRAIERSAEREVAISDAAARVISSQIHEGQTTPLYALASSGAITEGLVDQLERDYRRADMNDQLEIRTWVVALMHYVETRGDDVAAREGWAKLWLQHPEYEDTGLDDEDCCTECGMHFSEPHDPTCPRSHEDYPEEDDSFQSAPAEADPRAAREAAIQAKLGHISTGNLVRRMERAPDFGYDDEQVELSRRLREQGKTWRWSDSFTKPQVIIYELGEER